MDIRLRPAQPADYDFARRTYQETMRWMIERLFGWDQAQEDIKFALNFRLEDVRIVVADGMDAGWVQTRLEDKRLYIGQLYVIPELQRRGIGSRTLDLLVAEARQYGKPVDLSVVKINPALAFYTARGFRTVGEDRYKLHLRRDDMA